MRNSIALALFILVSFFFSILQPLWNWQSINRSFNLQNTSSVWEGKPEKIHSGSVFNVSQTEESNNVLSSETELVSPDYAPLDAGTFQFTIANDIQVAGNILEFDLNIVNTDASQPFEVACIQAGISLNPEIINGGEITCFIRNNTSGLVVAQQPTTVLFNSFTNRVELFSKPMPGAGNGTIISTNPTNPTRVCRIRLGNTVPWATGQANLAFSFLPEPHPTVVSQYLGGANINLVADITNCFSIAGNPIVNYPSPELPATYTVTGNGYYCSGGFPVIVGLENSQVGVIYKLYRDGLLMEYKGGTGAAISWDCLVAGLYTVDGTNAAGTAAMTGNALISIYPEPTIILSVDNNNVCIGAPVTLTASIQNPGTAVTYYWQIRNASGNQLVTTSSAAYTYVPSDGDLVSVDYSQTLPCQYCVESNRVLLTVKPPSEGGTVDGDRIIYAGSSTGPLTLAGNYGNILNWQKRLNSGAWVDIENTGLTYSEVPLEAGTWKYRAIVRNDDCQADFSDEASVTVLNRSLSVKVFPEGIYNPGTDLLNKARDGQGDRFENDTADLITIRLINSMVPYNEVYSFHNINLPTNGIVTVDVPFSLTSSCYLVINHRNSIETWSSVPVSLSGNMTFYNFTTGADKAFGFNQTYAGNSWVIYGGDNNQDGMVDQSDMMLLENSSSVFLQGYLPEDVKSDGLIDAGDMRIVDNNASHFVSSIFPFAQELPIVITYPASDITLTSTMCSGEITSQGASIVTARGICWSVSPDPMVEDSHTNGGYSTGIFTCKVTGLISGTLYYIRAYATNYSGTAYGEQYSFTSVSAGGGGPCPEITAVTYEGQTYNTVLVGTQCWLKENLNVGTRINCSQSQNATNGIKEKYCYDDNENNCATHGGLYQWDEIMQGAENQGTQGLCPVGWHVPTDAEWTTLTDFIGGSSIAGGKLKGTGTTRWQSPNTGATNESGFTAMPGGYSGYGSYYMGNSGQWWSSSSYSTTSARYRSMGYDATIVYRNSFVKSNGFSVRCVKDVVVTGAVLPTLTTGSISEIKMDSAVSGGDITDNGGDPVTARGVCWSTSSNPTILNSHTSDSIGSGIFISNLTGLLLNTHYYVRAYASNTAGTEYGSQISFTTVANQDIQKCPGSPTVLYEGQTYNTVQIGAQCWLNENLNTGKLISRPQYLNASNGIKEKYCYFDSETYCNQYGALYQWDEIMQGSTTSGVQGICPQGWHIPSDADWTTLTDFLGGEGIAGGKLKETGTAHWQIPNTGATNESGFTALAGGYIQGDMTRTYYVDNGERGYWWSSTMAGTSVFSRYMSNSNTNINSFSSSVNGHSNSVRCMKDASGTVYTLPTITTAGISYINSSSALSGGEITNDGGANVFVRGVCWGISPNPTLSNSYSSDGNGPGTFISILTGMTPNTLYYVRSYATSSMGTAYGSDFNFTTTATVGINPCQGTPTVLYEGQIYNTVEIGSQCWFKENLNVGTRIDLNSNQDATNGIKEKYCYDNLESNCAVYGGLYQWNETMQGSTTLGAQGICPSGWHIPTYTEWNTLTIYLGEIPVAGGAVKENGASHWQVPNTGATNISGFTALPAGYRYMGSMGHGNEIAFHNVHLTSDWWSSATTSNNAANRFEVDYSSSGTTTTNPPNFTMGYSVRCIRDLAATGAILPTVTTANISNIGPVSALSGGDITNDGGDDITARGICWSTESNPTPANSHTTDGDGIGSFVSNLTGLLSNTIYYVRAYATNSIGGTGYGNQVTFTTPNSP